MCKEGSEYFCASRSGKKNVAWWKSWDSSCLNCSGNKIWLQRDPAAVDVTPTPGRAEAVNPWAKGTSSLPGLCPLASVSFEQCLPGIKHPLPREIMRPARREHPGVFHQQHLSHSALKNPRYRIWLNTTTEFWDVKRSGEDSGIWAWRIPRSLIHAGSEADKEHFPDKCLLFNYFQFPLNRKDSWGNVCRLCLLLMSISSCSGFCWWWPKGARHCPSHFLCVNAQERKADPGSPVHTVAILTPAITTLGPGRLARR